MRVVTGGRARRLRRGDTPKPAVSSAATSPSASIQLLEAHCLGVLMRLPDLLYKIDRELQEKELARLSADDFQHSGHQPIFRMVQESLNQDMAEPLTYMINHFDLSTMERVDELLKQTEELNSNQDKVLEDLLRGVLELRRRSLRQNIEYMRFLMEDAQEQGDLTASQYLKTMVQHSAALKRINEALGDYTGDRRLYTKKDVNSRPLL
jgi:DNA primase